ncbi:hypothetical protein QQY03_20505, partial [Klebsiella pneumoniae]|uniref:LysR substrate-binding domain-containing protein n=1 Tax=Klebsiella pneumoniae TaxID=573 RepID=UPI003528D2D6
SLELMTPVDYILRESKNCNMWWTHTVPHFLFMLETLRNSDLVAVLPERLVRGQSGLVVVEPPLAVAGFEMLMLWHERWHRDPAHQWLRQFIVNSLEEQTC